MNNNSSVTTFTLIRIDGCDLDRFSFIVDSGDPSHVVVTHAYIFQDCDGSLRHGSERNVYRTEAARMEWKNLVSDGFVRVQPHSA